MSPGDGRARCVGHTAAGQNSRTATQTRDKNTAPSSSGQHQRPVLYRRHGKPGCTAKHRTWKTRATCIWPWAHWIIGDGPYATLSRCRYRVTTVMLHRTEAAALGALALIDDYGCGGACRQQGDAPNPH